MSLGFHPCLARLAVASGLLVLGACASLPAAAQTECPPAISPFAQGLESLEGYRVFTGPDGDSQVEPFRIDARSFVLPYNGQSIDILDLPTAPTRGVQIVAGPPNMVLPPKATPYKEMFILLAGSFTFSTRTFSAEMLPGSVLVFEDMGASHGHGGTIGPCGYVSLSIAP